MRLRPLPEVLDQDTRVALLDLARREPGVSVRRASDLVGVDYSTVQYHVRVLERHGALVCARLANALRLYPPDAVPAAADWPRLNALASETARVVADHVRARGAATLSDVTRELGIPRTTAQDHLVRLERAGVLEHWRIGPAKVYAPPRRPDA